MGTWAKLRPLHIKAISMDVTGTLVSFRGTLAQHYLGSAAQCGVNLPTHVMEAESTIIDAAFDQAYRETTEKYPCFGYNTMTGKEWWKICVLRSFTLAGVTTMGPRQAHDVFQRIYSVFGSQAAYERFDDARPFLDWAHRRGLVCGLLSNADERYGDSILPMLDLSMSGIGQQELQFQLFSKDYGLEKPDPKFFAAAVQRAAEAKQQETLHPSHVLHIGNDYTKDFEGARRAGMHAILLDRYHETERAKEWRRRGAVVLQDLMDVVEFLGQSQCKLGD